MTLNKPVIIADARYVDGKPVSRVYHLMTSNCLQDAVYSMRLETDEQTAMSFGYKYCGNCRQTEERQFLKEMTDHFISTSLMSDFLDSLPVEIEVRLYLHDPDRKTPKKIWSSRDTSSIT